MWAKQAKDIQSFYKEHNIDNVDISDIYVSTLYLNQGEIISCV